MGKKSNVINLQSNFIFCIHINIMNSYMSFYQVWTTIPQKIWSDHEKGKMVKIRVLTLEGQFLIFYLANGKLVSSMDSRTQWHHLYLFTRFKRSQLHWIDRWIFQSTDQKSTVHWKVKLWLFGQNQVPRVIIHQGMSKHETCSSRNLILQVRVQDWKIS